MWHRISIRFAAGGVRGACSYKQQAKWFTWLFRKGQKSRRRGERWVWYSQSPPPSLASAPSCHSAIPINGGNLVWIMWEHLDWSQSAVREGGGMINRNALLIIIIPTVTCAFLLEGLIFPPTPEDFGKQKQQQKKRRNIVVLLWYGCPQQHVEAQASQAAAHPLGRTRRVAQRWVRKNIGTGSPRVGTQPKVRF